MLARAALIGLAGWLLATAAFRVGGQLVLPSEGPVGAGPILLLGLAVVVAAVALRRLLAPGGKGADALALGLILPGMALDAGVVVIFDRAFPNMGAERADGFGALMLWGYALIGAAVALDGRRARPRRGRRTASEAGAGRPPETPRRRPPAPL